jgi:hypothetical protein
MLGHVMQLVDQVRIGAFGLGLGCLELTQNFLDAVDGGKNERYGLAGHRHAVTEFSHQRFGGVSQRFKSWKAEEAARPLDGVNKTEDVVQYLGVVRVLLETHKLIVNCIQTLIRLGQELAEKIIHNVLAFETPARDVVAPFRGLASFNAKRLSLVEQTEKNAPNK